MEKMYCWEIIKCKEDIKEQCPVFKLYLKRKKGGHIRGEVICYYLIKEFKDKKCPCGNREKGHCTECRFFKIRMHYLARNML